MWPVVRTTVEEFLEDNCPRMAAAMAYYAAFALAPALVLLIRIGGAFFDPAQVEGRIESEIAGAVGEVGVQQIQAMVAESARTEGGPLVSALGVLGLIVAATGLFNQLQAAVNEIWGVEPNPRYGIIKTFVIKRMLSLALLLMVAGVLLLTVFSATLVSMGGHLLERYLPSGVLAIYPRVTETALSLIATTGLFAIMFHFFPDADAPYRELWIGSFVTGLLFVAGKSALGMYLGSTYMKSVYGAAGSLALILIWIYYSTMIFLFGAEFTQVWIRMRGDGIHPAEGAVRVERKTEVVEEAPAPPALLGPPDSQGPSPNIPRRTRSDTETPRTG